MCLLFFHSSPLAEITGSYNWPSTRASSVPRCFCEERDFCKAINIKINKWKLNIKEEVLYNAAQAKERTWNHSLVIFSSLQMMTEINIMIHNYYDTPLHCRIRPLYTAVCCICSVAIVLRRLRLAQPDCISPTKQCGHKCETSVQSMRGNTWVCEVWTSWQ